MGSASVFEDGEFKRVLTSVIFLKLMIAMSFVLGWYRTDFAGTYSFFLHYDRGRPTGRYEALNNVAKTPVHRPYGKESQPTPKYDAGGLLRERMRPDVGRGIGRAWRVGPMRRA